MKLQKYASLCRDLNEEATVRNAEALKLHEQVEIIRSERDHLATELEQKRAAVATYERNETEREKSEQRIRKYEENMLDGSQKAVTLRDDIIADLSGRLEQALECLEIEREQRRQRRQIIFPNQRTPLDNSEDESNDLASEVKRLEASLQQSEVERDSMRDEMRRKELMWELERKSFQT